MMKNMRYLVYTIIAILMPKVVTAITNDTVVLNAFSGIYPGLGGGEFTAYTSDQTMLSYYSASAIVNTEGTWNGVSQGFETFCIETGVEFTPGNWGGPAYSYTVGNVAEPTPGTPGTGSGQVLTLGTAFLYYEFATGNLAGFDYTYGADRENDDNLLQAAIWYLQGGQTYGSFTVPTVENNSYYALAESEFGLGATNANNGEYSVGILQLWNSDGTAAQNQLVLTGDDPTPAPDGGMTVGLLGLGLVGAVAIQLWRRKDD